MSIRVLAFALFAGASLGYAAPPEKTNTPPTQNPADTIDVDALARAKDANGATPPAEDAPPQPVESPADVAPTEVAPAEAPPSDVPAGATPAPAPEAPAAPADAPAADTATPADATIDATKPPPPSDSEKRTAAGCVARATSLLDEAQKADYTNVTRDFDAKMRTDMPAAKFKQQWESLGQFGKLVARGQSHLGTGEGYTLVMIPLIFEKTNLVAQIACGSDGRIAGFHVTEAPKATPQSSDPQF